MKTTRHLLMSTLALAGLCCAETTAPNTPAAPVPEASDASSGMSPEMKQASEFFMHYFENPRPEQVSDMLTLSARLDPQTEMSNKLLLSVVFGEIFKANPNRQAGWVALVPTLPEAWQEPLNWSLRYARGEETSSAASQEPTIETLIACLGSYMATSDKRFPEYLFSLACASEEEPIHLRAASAAESCINLYESAAAIARAWFAGVSEEQKMNFARRVEPCTQQSVFGEVLHSAPEEDEADDTDDDEAPDDTLNESCVPEENEE